MKYYLIVILFIFCACKENQYQKEKDLNDVYRQKLSELKIQFEKVYEYEYKFGEVDNESGFLKEITEFDSLGNIISFKTFHKSEYLKDFNKVKNYEYNDQNNLIKIVDKDTLGEIKGIIQNIFEDGLNTERLIYSSSGKLEGKVIYKHNSNNNLVELISYEPNGSLEYKTIYNYNKEGFLINETNYGPTGIKKDYGIYKKISKNKFENLYYDEAGKLIDRYNYITNDKDLVLEYTWFNIEDSKQTKAINKFDLNDMLIETIHLGQHDEPISMIRKERIKFQQ